MKEGLARLYSGDFNYMRQEEQSDGSKIVTLIKDGEDKIYKFKVKNLYRENEEVLEEEVIDKKANTPPWTKQRLKEAKEWKEKKDKKK